MNEEQRKKYAEVIAKVWSDESFKKKLIESPKETLKEMGFEIPSNISIKVCDESDGTFYLIIPKKPESELSDEKLRQISGGSTWVGTITDCNALTG